MDRIDRKILDLLQQDASIHNSDLAAKVGLAPSSCLRRVRHLKKAGIIKKIVAVTDAEKLGKSIQAVVNIRLEEHGSDDSEDWLSRVADEQTVSQCYSVSGEIDAVVILSLSSMQEFQAVSKRLFSSDNNVKQYFTLFIMETHKFDLSN